MVRPDSPLEVQEARSLAELRDDWTRLADLDGDVFKTWEWARAWEDAHGSDGRLLLTFGRPGEPLAGIARLERIGPTSMRLVGFEGQGAADQAGPVCAPDDRAAVAVALRRAIATGHGQPRALLARGLMREEGWAELLDGVVLKGQPSPVLDIAGQDWAAWLAAKSSNFRQQVQRRERKLVRDHGLTYRLVTTAAELNAALDEFVAFHDTRWQGASNFLSSEGRVLHPAFARAARERGWLRLWVAELDGRAAAYWLGYRFGGDYWFFQLARDTERHRDEHRHGAARPHRARRVRGGRRPVPVPVRYPRLQAALRQQRRRARDGAGDGGALRAAGATRSGDGPADPRLVSGAHPPPRSALSVWEGEQGQGSRRSGVRASPNAAGGTSAAPGYVRPAARV